MANIDNVRFIALYLTEWRLCEKAEREFLCVRAKKSRHTLNLYAPALKLFITTD